VFSKPHPRAVDTLGPAWAAWIEGTLLHPRNPRAPLILNGAQRLVLDRALEVDADGRLVWSEILVSAPRQVMKSVLLYAVAAARAAHAEHFGEQQTVVHTANRLVAARRVHSMAWLWAEARGFHVSKALDTATISWPDGSTWNVSSLSSVWGSTATAVMADEIWNVPPEVVEDALLPTLVSVDQSQLWLLSCANAGATVTYARAKRRSTLPDTTTMIAEWSAAPDDDRSDPAVWRAASPVWTEQRERMMRGAQASPGFAEQWLNIWPNTARSVQGWPVGWSELPLWLDRPRPGLVAAIETATDRSRFGVAVAELVDGTVRVASAGFTTLDDATRQLARWAPGVVLAGVTMASEVLGGFEVIPVGLRETRVATPILADLVRRGLIRHDHDTTTLHEVELARTTPTEGGELLSARRSEGPVPTVKAVMWAAWAAFDGRFAPVEGEIW
jgi:hypothetical protein